jgi:hypothetical protein
MVAVITAVAFITMQNCREPVFGFVETTGKDTYVMTCTISEMRAEGMIYTA